MIYCPEEFDWAYIFPECGRILPGPSFFMLLRGLLEIKNHRDLSALEPERYLEIDEPYQAILQVVN